MTDTIKIKEEREWVWWDDPENGPYAYCRSDDQAPVIRHERDIPGNITGADRERLTRFIRERRELDDSCEIRGLHGGIVGVRFRDGVFEYCDPGELDRWQCPTTHISYWSVNLRAWFERNRPLAEDEVHHNDAVYKLRVNDSGELEWWRFEPDSKKGVWVTAPDCRVGHLHTNGFMCAYFQSFPTWVREKARKMLEEAQKPKRVEFEGWGNDVRRHVSDATLHSKRYRVTLEEVEE